MAKKPLKKKDKQTILLFGTGILFIILVTLGVVVVRKYNSNLTKRGNEAEPVDMIESGEVMDMLNSSDDEYIDNGPPQDWLTDDEPEEEPPKDTVILFAGDVLFDYGMPQHYDESGIGGVVSPEVLSLMTGADITMVNQEFPFGTGGTAQDKEYTFRCNPAYVTALSDMGVDVVSIANNHALDYGKDALTQTFATLEGAGIAFAGAGPDVERASEVQVFEVNDLKIGFLAASRVIPNWSWNITDSQPGMLCTYDSKILCEAISRAKEQCDYVFVYVHWGIEREEFPQDYEFTLAKEYARAGADGVIGSHPHVLQGMELAEGVPVFYSLGNFIFNVNIERTMMVSVTISPEGNMTWRIIPCYASGGITNVAEGEKAAGIYSYLQSISFDTVINDLGEISWVAGADNTGTAGANDAGSTGNTDGNGTVTE